MDASVHRGRGSAGGDGNVRSRRANRSPPHPNASPSRSVRAVCFNGPARRCAQAGPRRGAPDEEGAERRDPTRSRTARRQSGQRTIGVARCSRCARRCGSTRAPGSSGCCATPTSSPGLYVGDDRTDIDAFRGLERAGRDGPARHALRIGVASDEGPRSSREEADAWSTAPTGSGSSSRPLTGLTEPVRFVDFLKATVLLSAGSATLLAALTVARVAASDDSGRGVAVGWWLSPR